MKIEAMTIMNSDVISRIGSPILGTAQYSNPKFVSSVTVFSFHTHIDAFQRLEIDADGKVIVWQWSDHQKSQGMAIRTVKFS
jgi:hypothetical protein